jgi:hypothetical protein
MSELAEVKRQLGADGERLQAIFVTVDPARDTAEMLKAYMGNFDPSLSRCARNAEQLAAVAKDFKIYYKKVEGKTESSYTMDHSAGSYIYDTRAGCACFRAMARARRPCCPTCRPAARGLREARALRCDCSGLRPARPGSRGRAYRR